MINNEILRFENGIKEDGFSSLQPNVSAANQGIAKNESFVDGADEKITPSEGLSMSNKNVESTRNCMGQGSVYSNMEMVMK